MNNDKFISFDDLMNDLKEKDPQEYIDIKKEAKAEVEERLHGGKRLGAGRKKTFEKQGRFNNNISLEALDIINSTAKKYKVSKAVAADTLIKASIKTIKPKDFKKF